MTINWTSVREEAIKLLGDLVRINTTNPPGNELEAACYLQEILRREGIQSTIYEKAPRRANLVARLAGNGSGRPLVMLAHLDVVTANPAQWSHDPFGGEVADDYLWGRGTLDMKGMLTMEVLTMLLLKRSGVELQRDLILVAAADEEVGGVEGMEWLITQEIPGLKTAEFVINEGGEGTLRDGVPVYSCQSGEKGLLWVKLGLKGTPGHASVPLADNAVLGMAEILGRIGRASLPVALSQTTRGFLKGLAEQKGIALPQEETELDAALLDFSQQFLSDELTTQAMFYNTISPTMLNASQKTNVLPELCEATLDCRLVPGETPDSFLAKLKEIVNDPRVTYEILQQAVPTESRLNTALFTAMQKAVKQEDPNSVLVPFLSPGCTDSRFFRHLGIAAYGFMPVLLTESEIQRMHGIDERLSLENLERGTRILYQAVREVVTG